MTEAEILEVFSTTLVDLLGDDSIVLTMATQRSEVAGWDSFNYINFIVAIEVEYDVKFGVSDVEAFKNVGDIVTELLSLLGDKN